MELSILKNDLVKCHITHSLNISWYFIPLKNFKVRHTQFSRYGFTIEVVENTKFPIFNSAKSFIKESGFATYTTSVGIKNEFEKKKEQKYE